MNKKVIRQHNRVESQVGERNPNRNNNVVQKQSQYQSQSNLGLLDRCIRSAVGGWLLYSGFQNKTALSSVKTMVGGLLLNSGVRGQDSILRAFGASTQMGAENNVLNLIKQFKPGTQIPPSQTEQATPNPAMFEKTQARNPAMKTLQQELAVK
jgi:hypothetical protein